MIFMSYLSTIFFQCVRKWQENKGRQRCVDIAFTKVEKPNERLFLYTFTGNILNFNREGVQDI